MAAIVLDDVLRAKLNGLNAFVPVRDESGQFVGCFLPTDMFDAMFEAWADSEVTDEELDAAGAAFRKKGGLPTAEAIRYVRQMAGEGAE